MGYWSRLGIALALLLYARNYFKLAFPFVLNAVWNDVLCVTHLIDVPLSNLVTNSFYTLWNESSIGIFLGVFAFSALDSKVMTVDICLLWLWMEFWGWVHPPPHPLPEELRSNLGHLLIILLLHLLVVSVLVNLECPPWRDIYPFMSKKEIVIYFEQGVDRRVIGQFFILTSIAIGWYYMYSLMKSAEKGDVNALFEWKPGYVSAQKGNLQTPALLSIAFLEIFNCAIRVFERRENGWFTNYPIFYLCLYYDPVDDLYIPMTLFFFRGKVL